MSAADSLFPPDEPGLTTKEFVAAADFAETGDFSHLGGHRPVVVGRARDLFIGRHGGFCRPVTARLPDGRVRGVPSRTILDAAEAMGITEYDLEHAE